MTSPSLNFPQLCHPADKQCRILHPSPSEFSVIIQWVHELKHRQMELQLQNEELRIAAVAFDSHEGIIITDARQLILKVNQAFSEITGYSAQEVIGKSLRCLESDRHSEEFYAEMWQTLEETGRWEGEIWNRRKNTDIYPEYLMMTAILNAQQHISHYVAVFHDISESKNAAEAIERLAFYDPLTALPNRRLLMDRLKLALACSHRNGRRGALLFIDVDNFKGINDTFGHDVGDLLLQKIAERLKSSVREGDTVARLGGDEFIVMLEDLSYQFSEAASQTLEVGYKILAALNLPYFLNDITCHSTPSIGCTVYSGHEKKESELLKQADIAMYQAKNSGRNTLCFFGLQNTP